MDKLFTIKETMAILKISKTGLYRLMSSDRLKHVKLGGRTMFKESELNRFIESLNGKKEK